MVSISSNRSYRICSGAELETQIEIIKHLSFGKPDSIKLAEAILQEVMPMLNKMIKTLE